jgi:hypothetical protein
MGADTMRSRYGRISQGLLVLGVLCLMGLAPRQTVEQDQGPLQDILARSARYCERLKGMALHFVCHEEITIDTFDYAQKSVWRVGRAAQEIDLRLRRKGQTDYLYDYQLIRKGDLNREKRILLRTIRPRFPRAPEASCGESWNGMWSMEWRRTG